MRGRVKLKTVFFWHEAQLEEDFISAFAGAIGDHTHRIFYQTQQDDSKSGMHKQ